MKCFPYHFDFIETFFKICFTENDFLFSVGFGGGITMASVSNNLSVLNIRGEDSVFLGNESLERNLLLSVLKRLAFDYKLFIFPQKTPVRLPHASKVSRCSAIDRRPVVK